MNTLGVTIREARERKHLSQTSLGKRVGASRATISRLEVTGITSTDLLERIADELELEELPLGSRRLQAGDLSAADLADALRIAIEVLSHILNALERREHVGVSGGVDAIDTMLARLATFASANRSAASPVVKRATRRISVEAPRGRYASTAETRGKGSDRKR
jgi:transcriptional regulator with XRE-family HTH domain